MVNQPIPRRAARSTEPYVMLHRLKKNKSFIAITNQLTTNVKAWKFLGSGCYGNAYDMRDGRVCKITRSEREVRAASKLLRNKKKYPYLYKILNVFVIRSSGKFLYGLIITPKYKKLTDSQKAELYELFCFLDLAPKFRLRSMGQVKNKIRKAVRDYYFARSAYAIVNNVIDKRIKTFKKFNILYMLRNLKDARLGPEDMHYDNILRDGNHFVLIDIAC